MPPLRLFENCFSGLATEGPPFATPQDSLPHGEGACCPELFGYLLPPLSLEKTVAASALHGVTKGVGDRRAELFREPHRAPVVSQYIVWVGREEVRVRRVL